MKILIRTLSLKIVQYPSMEDFVGDRIGRSTVNRKVGFSSSFGDGPFCFRPQKITINKSLIELFSIKLA